MIIIKGQRRFIANLLDSNQLMCLTFHFVFHISPCKKTVTFYITSKNWFGKCTILYFCCLYQTIFMHCFIVGRYPTSKNDYLCLLRADSTSSCLPPSSIPLPHLCDSSLPSAHLISLFVSCSLLQLKNC